MNGHRRASLGRLDFSVDRRLWGRAGEVNQIRSIFDRICEPEAPVQVCMVHGLSGTGKTRLCRESTKHVPIFLEGKFEQYVDFSSPYSAIVQALDGLGKALLLREEDDKDVEDFRNALSLEGKVLTRLIPSFAQLVLNEDLCKSSSGNLNMASERLAVALRAFLRTFCTQSRPLVLFIDDVQWGDVNSLQLLSAAVADQEAHHLLLLMGYRDEESSRIDSFLSSLPSSVHDVPVKNLNTEALNDMVAEIVSRDPSDTKELAELIHQKTFGNPFYAMQFLEGLKTNKLLTFDIMSVRWNWKMEEIRSQTVVAENVADFVTRRIVELDYKVLQVLQLAACLGFLVDLQLLRRLHDALSEFYPENQTPDESQKENETATFNSSIAVAQEENLVVATEFQCRFTHDRIQQCAYELIPAGTPRERLHFAIGLHISQLGQDQFVFLAADQLNRGSSCIKNDADRLALIQLNVKASKAAQKRASVVLVADFLSRAVDLVKSSDWDRSYDLVLDLYCSLAEVESTRGDFDKSNDLVQTVLSNSKSDNDTVRVLAARAKAHFSRLDCQAALRDSRKALRLLGVHMPMSNYLSLFIELKRTKRLLQGFSDNDLLELPLMTDVDKEEAVMICLDCCVYAWSNNDSITYVLSCLEMMKLSLLHGKSDVTPQAFGAYAIVLAFMGEKPQAFRFAQLALNSIASRKSIPPTYVSAYCFVNHVKLPCALSIEPMLTAYRIGIETGDMLWGCICLGLYCDFYKFCGLPLGTFASDMRRFAGQLKLCHQTLMLSLMLPNYQLALNLSGQSDDSVEISWDAIKKHGFLDDADTDVENNNATIVLDYNQIFNAYILGELDVAREALDRVLSRKIGQRRYEGNHFLNYMFNFLDGLVGREVYAATKKRRYHKFSEQALRWLTKTNTVDTFPLRRLLEAQKVAMCRSVDGETARQGYNEAIALLARAGFTHFCAIANEQIGKNMLVLEDNDWAEHYLASALRLYQEWGASVKTQQMLDMYGFLTASKASVKRTSNIRGLARFDSNKDTSKSEEVSSSRRVSEATMLPANEVELDYHRSGEIVLRGRT